MSHGEMSHFCFPQFATDTLPHADDFVSTLLQTANKQDALVYFIASRVPLTLIAKQVDVLLFRRINADAGKRFVQRFSCESAMLPCPSAPDGSSGRTFTDEDELRFFVATHCRLE